MDSKVIPKFFYLEELFGGRGIPGVLLIHPQVERRVPGAAICTWHCLPGAAKMVFTPKR